MTAPRRDIPRLTDLPLDVDGSRVRLRPQREADAEALFPFVTDPQVCARMSWAPHASIDETRAWLRGNADELAAGTFIAWTIEHEGAPIGCISLDGITWAVRAVRFDRAELGYWIGPPHHGKGLMTDAVFAAMRWGFDTLGLHKITVRCFEDNTGSRRVIEKSGFRFIGRMEDDVWRDARWHAHLCYELTAAEWADTSNTLRFRRP